MIRNTIITLTLATVTAWSAQQVRKLPNGSLVVDSIRSKSEVRYGAPWAHEMNPSELLSKFGVKYDAKKAHASNMFNGNWSYTKDKKSHLLEWTHYFKTNYKINGRDIIYFRAKFSAPLDSTRGYKVWDSFYFLDSRDKNKCICKGPNERFPWCRVNGHLVSP